MITKPSDAHLRAFGSLIYEYANAETGLKICLSGILDVPLHITLILTEPYSAVNLRTVVRAVSKEYLFPAPGDLERFSQIVGDLKVHGPLRNFIAHSRWTEGVRPGAIKPRNVDIRSERAVFKGSDPDERDWTAAEIEECAQKIVGVSGRILQFMAQADLTERVTRHMDSTSSETD